MSAAPGPGAVALGLNAFGEIPLDPHGGRVSDAEAVRTMVDEAVRAERIGLDGFCIGEHYRPDQVDTASMVALAAIAGRTERITVGTSVAVLSTQDPVRLYHQYATLDAASSGRAGLVLGRASAPESFALFGLSMDDYDQLFEENLDLFLSLRAGEPVSWSGLARPPLDGYAPRPRLDPGAAKPWVGIGGSPDSVLRAAHRGLPLMMAIIGGAVERFAGHSRYYRRTCAELGVEPGPIGQHSVGHVAPTDEEAAETFWPIYRTAMEGMAARRGTAVPDREAFDREVESGALFVGAPATVARKIVDCVRLLGLSRFDLKYDMGGTTAHDRVQTVELLGTAVAPLVEELLRTEPAPDGASRDSAEAPADPRRGPNAIFGGRTDALGAKRDARRADAR